MEDQSFSGTCPTCGQKYCGAEIERLRERCEAYKGQVRAGADEIERMRASQERLKSAIEFAHSEGFQWPSDPMAEFVDGPNSLCSEKRRLGEYGH
jgi:hypothetical protein